MKIKQCELAGSDNCVEPIGLRCCEVHDDYCNRIDYTDAEDAGQLFIKPFKEIQRLRAVVAGLEKYNAELLQGAATIKSNLDTAEACELIKSKRIAALEAEKAARETEINGIMLWRIYSHSRLCDFLKTTDRP